MRHSGRWLTAAIVVFVLVALTAIAYGLPAGIISAVPEPSRVETWIANAAKDWFLSRGAKTVPAEPPRTAASIAAGQGTYGMACAFCHGRDGRTLPAVAHSMYPRVLNLSSPEVQKNSDKEIFWVIKHGLRMTAMPGFGPILSDQEIWQLTDYVRSLGAQPRG